MDEEPIFTISDQSPRTYIVSGCLLVLANIPLLWGSSYLWRLEDPELVPLYRALAIGLHLGVTGAAFLLFRDLRRGKMGAVHFFADHLRAATIHGEQRVSYCDLSQFYTKEILPDTSASDAQMALAALTLNPARLGLALGAGAHYMLVFFQIGDSPLRHAKVSTRRAFRKLTECVEQANSK